MVKVKSSARLLTTCPFLNAQLLSHAPTGAAWRSTYWQDSLTWPAEAAGDPCLNGIMLQTTKVRPASKLLWTTYRDRPCMHIEDTTTSIDKHFVTSISRQWLSSIPYIFKRTQTSRNFTVGSK